MNINVQRSAMVQSLQAREGFQSRDKQTQRALHATRGALTAP